MCGHIQLYLAFKTKLCVLLVLVLVPLNSLLRSLARSYPHSKKPLLSKDHYGLLESHFFQAASISRSGFPWVSGSPGGPTELDFKGSGCDPEVLEVLEPKNLQTRSNLTKKS